MTITQALQAQYDHARRRAAKARYEGRMDNAAYWDGKAELLGIRLNRAAA